MKTRTWKILPRPVRSASRQYDRFQNIPHRSVSPNKVSDSVSLASVPVDFFFRRFVAPNADDFFLRNDLIIHTSSGLFLILHIKYPLHILVYSLPFHQLDSTWYQQYSQIIFACQPPPKSLFFRYVSLCHR